MFKAGISDIIEFRNKACSLTLCGKRSSFMPGSTALVLFQPAGMIGRA